MDISKVFAIGCFMLAAIIHPGYADVYKWKDVEGNLRYSDIPPRSDTKYEVLNKKKEQKASNLKITQVEVEKKSDKQNSVVEKLKPVAAQPSNEDKAIDAENCQAAKSNLATYKNGGRIKRVNEKGEVQYLTDADIASAAKVAQKDVENYCNASSNLVGR